MLLGCDLPPGPLTPTRPILSPQAQQHGLDASRRSRFDSWLSRFVATVWSPAWLKWSANSMVGCIFNCAKFQMSGVHDLRSKSKYIST